MLLILLYLKEIFWILSYLVLSAIFCILIFILKYHSFILCSTFVILKLVKKKLFIFNIFDIFSIMNLLLFFYLFFFLWFLFVWYLYVYVCSSFYENQKKACYKFLCYSIFFRLLSFAFLNFILIYLLIYLLIFWKFTTVLNSFHLFSIQINLFDFVQTWIQINCKFNLFVDILLLINCIVFININQLQFYKTWKTYKNQFLFFIFLFLWICLNDFFYVILFCSTCLESYFLFLCYNMFFLYKFIDKNANFKTNSKKFS